MRIRRTSISLVALACWSLAGAPPAFAQWSALGLSGRQTVKLRAHGGFLYACTADGLYRLRTDDPDTLWSQIGFAGQSVLDLAVLNPQTFLAAKTMTPEPSDTVSLFRSTDVGETWQPFQNGFGGAGNRQARMLLASSGSDTVFAVASRIWKSTDGGMSWRNLGQGFGLNALERAPANPQLLWAGGETAIFSPYVLKSTNGGETWTRFDLVVSGADNAVDAIAGHPSDPNIVYLGMEGMMMKSEDGGTTWSTLTPPDAFVYTFGLAIRPFLPLEVFAAGNSFPPDPLGVVFHQSTDGGQSWQAISYAADAGNGVRHLLLAAGAAQETVYVATDNGVYRYSQGTVDVPLPELGRGRVVLRCRPNPFVRATVIEFDLPAAENVSLAIFDALGRKVATPFQGALGSGLHRINYDARGLRSGIYVGQLRAGARTATIGLLHWE